MRTVPLTSQRRAELARDGFLWFRQRVIDVKPGMELRLVSLVGAEIGVYRAERVEGPFTDENPVGSGRRKDDTYLKVALVRVATPAPVAR